MSSNKYCSKHPFFFLLFSDGFENRPFTVNIVNIEKPADENTKGKEIVAYLLPEDL